MRLLALIGSLLLLACTAGGGTNAAAGNQAVAATDLTLRYASPDAPQSTMVIERDSAGRIRISEGERQALIIRDGRTYILFTPPGPGGQIVAQLEDYLAVGAELRARMIAAGAMTGGTDNTAYRLDDRGEASIGQWRGRRYEVSPQGSGPNLEAVISSDPALADAHAVTRQAIGELERAARAVLVYPEQFTRMSLELLGRGMPIAWNGRTLQSMSTDPVAASRFELPTPPLSRDALRARANP